MRLTFSRRHSQHQLRDLLMAHADALVSGTLDRDRLRAQYDMVDQQQVEGLLALAERLSQSLIEIVPSEQFVAQLRRQLADAPGLAYHRSLWGRIRALPPRTQIVAGIGGATLTAGVVILASRSVPEAIDNWRQRRAATA
jgi:hypothetical protein